MCMGKVRKREYFSRKVRTVNMCLQPTTNQVRMLSIFGIELKSTPMLYVVILYFCESQWHTYTTGEKALLPVHFAEEKSRLKTSHLNCITHYFFRDIQPVQQDTHTLKPGSACSIIPTIVSGNLEKSAPR